MTTSRPKRAAVLATLALSLLFPLPAAAQSSFAFSASTYDFGNLPIGAAVDLIIHFTNTGTQSGLVGGFSVLGAHTDSFLVVADAMPAVLEPGGASTSR